MAGKDSVAQVGLGQGANHHPGAGGGDTGQLGRACVGGVHQVPVSIQLTRVGQGIDGGDAQVTETLFDFPLLLRNMYMQGHVLPQQGPARLHQLGQDLGWHRTQGMGRQTARDVAQVLDQAQVVIQVIVSKALLAGLQGRVEATAHIQHRQHHQAYTHIGRGAYHRCAHVRRGCAVGKMVQVMKFPHGREAGGEHLAVGLTGDDVEGLGGDPVGQPIHVFAPVPETVGAAVALAKARQHPLETVTVGVGHTRQGEIAGPGFVAGILYCRDESVIIHQQAGVLTNTVRGEDKIKAQCLWHCGDPT